MNLETRSQIITGLFEVQTDLFAILQTLRVEKSLTVAVPVQLALNQVAVALEEFKPVPQPMAERQPDFWKKPCGICGAPRSTCNCKTSTSRHIL